MGRRPERTRILCIGLSLIATIAAAGAVDIDQLDKNAIKIVLPDQIPWKDRPFMPGLKEAVLAGDPSKPGLYVVLVKWLPHNMSRPHFHPNDRFIKVLSGTWWVGTGDKFDPDKTVPLPAGSFVVHYAKQVHYDGAKDEEAVLEIVGEGPANSTPAGQPPK
ncbi:MAG TPA: cupin domain-containing protein [Hyphomicrobiales bacterium]|nr:cupin domain-containing protein [Hyphomicrobiales bacterium]